MPEAARPAHLQCAFSVTGVLPSAAVYLIAKLVGGILKLPHDLDGLTVSGLSCRPGMSVVVTHTVYDTARPFWVRTRWSHF